jgi:hypothetical protein
MLPQSKAGCAGCYPASCAKTSECGGRMIADLLLTIAD